jgi:steroid delta-isomerase-like uncharacterized protein
MNATNQEPKNVARKLLEAIDRQDWKGAKDLCAPNVRVHIGGQAIDFTAWMGMGQMFYAAFPDGKHEIENVVGEGDRVVLRCTWHGTHRGAFQGIPASGKSVALVTFLEEHVVDGRVVEYRGLFDAMGMMQQIGAIPSG